MCPERATTPRYGIAAVLVAAVVAGSALVATGTTAAGAAEPAATPQPAVGVNAHLLWSDWTDAQRITALDKFAAAGISWIRLDIGWASVEYRGRGVYEEWFLQRIGTVLDAARARGIAVTAILWSTPPWAGGGPTNAVPAASDYASIARFMASRFRGKVAAWEVWNEPNLSSFWASASAADYAALVRAAYPAFKAGDPGTSVVIGGVSEADDPWLAQMYAAGVSGSYDVLAPHPYQAPSDQGPELADDGTIYRLAHMAAVRGLMVANGDTAKELWIGEVGWSTHTNAVNTPNWALGVTPASQAAYTTRTLDFVRSQLPYVSKVFFYTDRDTGDSDPHQNGFGLLNHDLSEKPAFAALRAYTSDKGGYDVFPSTVGAAAPPNVAPDPDPGSAAAPRPQQQQQPQPATGSTGVTRERRQQAIRQWRPDPHYLAAHLAASALAAAGR